MENFYKLTEKGVIYFLLTEEYEEENDPDYQQYKTMKGGWDAESLF